VVNSARARAAPGRNTAARWQFWNASRTPKWRSVAARMAELAIIRSSWPGLVVRQRHVVVGEVGAGGAQLPGQARDELPRVRQRGLDAGGGRGVVYFAVPGLVEQVRGNGQ
jgi:hypothetical protein